jgi:hypothetical protein
MPSLGTLPPVLLFSNRALSMYLRRGWGRLVMKTQTHEIYEGGIYVRNHLDIFVNWHEVTPVENGDSVTLRLSDGTEIDIPQEMVGQVREMMRRNHGSSK